MAWLPIVFGPILLVCIAKEAVSGVPATGFLLRLIQRNTLDSFVCYRLSPGMLVLSLSGK